MTYLASANSDVGEMFSPASAVFSRCLPRANLAVCHLQYPAVISLIVCFLFQNLHTKDELCPVRALQQQGCS